MKILVVTTAFPRWAADHRAPFIWEACKAVQALGNQVAVIAMHNPGSKTRENWDGIEIIRPRFLPDWLEIIQKDRAGIPSFWKSYPWLRFLLVPFFLVHTLTIIRNAGDYDLIHANWTLSGLCVWLGQFIHHKNFVVTVQGSDIFQAGKSKLIRWITKKMLISPKRIIALSTQLEKELTQWGIPASHIIVIPNGVNINQFKPTDLPRNPIILYVGSMVESKGVHHLLEAFAQFVVDDPNYQLTFIGDGSLKNVLQERSKKLGISEKVNFLGSLPNDQVRNWMQQAKLFVLPSLSEGLGVVLLEAMACGTPCIGCSIGGIPDIITPEVGLLVPPGDIERITSALREIISDEKLWLKMSVNARRRIEENFSWQMVGDEINQVYHAAY
jgi:glycosyltransferase involved in cell wall biosynthesis